MGPRGVAAQSILLANWIFLGKAADIGSRVQSKEEFSGYLACIISVVKAALCAAILACLGIFASSSSLINGLDTICMGEEPVVAV